MKRITLILILILTNTTGACGQKKESVAWWYEGETTAKCDQEGVTLFNYKDRCYILSTHYMLKSIPGFDDGLINKLGFEFALVDDLNGDGRAEYIGIGTYNDQRGKGRFLAVSKDKSFTNIARLFHHSGIAGFSALKEIDGVIRWYFCMECNDFETLIVSGESYLLQ